MTTPVFHAADTVFWLDGLSSPTPDNITLPDNIAAGDLLLIFMPYGTLDGAADIDGFTLLDDWTGSFGDVASLFYRVATGSEGATVSGTYLSYAIVARCSGVDPDAPFTGTATGESYSSDPAELASITTTVDNALLVTFGYVEGGSNVVAVVSGETSAWDETVAWQSGVIATEVITPPGATGTRTIDISDGDDIWGYMGAMVALAPAEEASGDAEAVTTTALFDLTTYSVTATGQRNETATTGTAALELTGQSVTASAGTTATTSPATMELTGQPVSVAAGATAITTTAAMDLVGQPVTVTGETVVDGIATTSTALMQLTGQTVTASASVAALTGTAALELTGHPVSATAGAMAATSPATMELTGQSITATGQRNETAVTNTATFALTGYPVVVTSTVDAVAETTTAQLVLTGQPITVSAGAMAATDTAILVLRGQGMALNIAGVPTEFGPPLTATLSSQTVLTATITGASVLSADLSSQSVLTATLRGEPVLTATPSSEPVLTARLRATE
jgi:hypothetical protein